MLQDGQTLGLMGWPSITKPYPSSYVICVTPGVIFMPHPQGHTPEYFDEKLIGPGP